MNGSQEIEKAQILHNSMEFCKICVLSTVKNPAEAKASAGYNIRHNNRGYGIIVSYRFRGSQPCYQPTVGSNCVCLGSRNLCCLFFNIRYCDFVLSLCGDLLRKSIFCFDAVELFKHRLCAKPEEHERCHCANEIDRNAGEVIAQDDLPVYRV